jgi:pilus assembly protein Flp/PilA
MIGLSSKVRQFVVSEDGPTAVEYAVMLAMIITACVTIVKNLGTSISGSFSSASSALGSGS